MKYLKFCSLFLIFSCLCNTSEDVNIFYVRQYVWKYVQGYNINDFIYFDNELILDNKKDIYIKKKKIGKLLSSNKSEILIQSKSGEIGYYYIFDDVNKWKK